DSRPDLPISSDVRALAAGQLRGGRCPGPSLVRQKDRGRGRPFCSSPEDRQGANLKQGSCAGRTRGRGDDSKPCLSPPKLETMNHAEIKAGDGPDGAGGTTPPGASDERSAAQAVRGMFDQIAPRYDLANHVLSMNVDRLWWRRTARAFSHILARDDARVLDLCAGTGDMSVALRAVADSKKSSAAIFALDFSHQMLQHGLNKYTARKIQPLEADALQLPLADSSMELVVSSFGFRNL